MSFFFHYVYYFIHFFSTKIILERGEQDQCELISVKIRGKKKLSLQEDLDGGCGWTRITGNDTVTYHVTYSEVVSKTYT